MKMGHCTGTKREKKGSQDWYRAIEQATIERITKEWAAFAEAEVAALEAIMRDVREVRAHAIEGYEAWMDAQRQAA